jgi:hypothetical protein
MNDDTIVYYISGLGCKQQTNEEQRVQNWLLDYAFIPISNIKYKCHTTFSGLKNICRTYFNRIPLTESAFVESLVEDILTDLHNPDYNYVLVLAHSFGGSIINIVAEYLNTYFLSNIETQSVFNKLKINTFGSIYFSPMEKVSNISILNYISTKDVAIKCNKITPIPYEQMDTYLKHYNIKHYGDERNIYDNIDKIICKYKKEDYPTNIRQICLWKYNDRQQNGRPLCLDRVIDTSRVSLGPRSHISILNWKEHNYYRKLTNAILHNFLIVKSIVSSGYNSTKANVTITHTLTTNFCDIYNFRTEKQSSFPFLEKHNQDNIHIDDEHYEEDVDADVEDDNNEFQMNYTAGGIKRRFTKKQIKRKSSHMIYNERKCKYRRGKIGSRRRNKSSSRKKCAR